MCLLSRGNTLLDLGIFFYTSCGELRMPETGEQNTGMACILSSEAAHILQFPSCLGGRQTLELVLRDGFSH